MGVRLIRTLIVEDQPNVLNEIRFLVEHQKGFIVSAACGTVKEARQLVASIQPDLLLLDIHLPDGTGFDVLNDSAKECITIFLTAYDKHAIRAIKCGALDYLLKPIDESEFSLALSKAAQLFPVKAEQINIASRHHKNQTRNRLVLRSHDFLQVVEIDQIVYCQSDAGYTTFYLNDKQQVLVSKTLKEFEDILTGPLFLRPHQSYLINTNYIDGYDREGYIHLKNHTQRIPVAVRRKEAVMEFFNQL